MAVETDDERAIFFSANDFGTTATLSVSGVESQVTGIFEDDYQAIDAGGLVPFASSSPTFHGRTSDLSAAVEGSTLTISGTNYVIRVVMDDGTGLTMLQLEEQ